MGGGVGAFLWQLKMKQKNESYGEVEYNLEFFTRNSLRKAQVFKIGWKL